MKKILILSYNFAPRHTVGAIRPTKLAQYLAADGNEVDVVTVKPYGALDHSMDASLEGLHRTDYIDCVIVNEKPAAAGAPAAPAAAAAPAKKKKSLLRKLKREAYEYKKIHNSKKFAAAFARLVRSDIERFRSYDAVISTYGPVASHLCGLTMKKLCPGVRWIADFRDPMVVNDSSAMTARYRGRIQERVCRRADRLVAVSNGYYDRIFDSEAKKKACVIYNGFDRRDVAAGEIEPDGRFSFTYVGAMYDGKRDITPLFTALGKLVEAGKIKAEDIVLKYAGNTFPVLESQARRSGFAGKLENLGTLTRGDCLKLQGSSRHLILATWNERGEGGVFPGKFLEYIMTGRPIVSLVSGEVPGSEVTQVMKKARLGATYEDATAAADIPALCDYLENDYRLWREGNPPDFVPDPAETGRFDFANTAKSFEELI